MGSIAPEARRALFLETASSPPRRALLDATGVATGGACGFFFPVFPLPTPSLLRSSAVSGSSQPPFFTTFMHRTHPVCGGSLVNLCPFSVSSRHFAMAASLTRHTAHIPRLVATTLFDFLRTRRIPRDPYPYLAHVLQIEQLNSEKIR